MMIRVGLILFIFHQICFSAIPDLVEGDSIEKYHDWTLGITGARGWIYGKKTTAQSRQILITKIEKDSPSQEYLIEGDVIVSINDRKISYDARHFMGFELLKSERLGKLKLTIFRKDVGYIDIEIPIEKSSFQKTTPYNCQKATMIFNKCLDNLSKAKINESIPRYLSALAMLSSGNKEYIEVVKQIISKIQPPKESGYSTWFWGYKNLLLAEYYMATKDPNVLPTLKKYSEAIVLGQSDTGTWGHSMSIPNKDKNKNGRPSGYGALNAAGLVCHLSLVIASKAIDNKDIKEAIKRGNDFLKWYHLKGAVPYGYHEPYLGSHDSNGKSSLAALIFSIQGMKKEARFFGSLALYAHAEEGGHSGIYFANLWQGLGVYAGCGQLAYSAYLKKKLWYLTLSRNSRGSYPYQGQPGLQDKYRNWDMTPAVALNLSIPLKNLYITGKRDIQKEISPNETLTLSQNAVNSILLESEAKINESSKAYSLLSSYSPIIRQRAANYLRGISYDISIIKDLINSKNEEYIKGALQLISLGNKKHFLKDELVKIIEDKNASIDLKLLALKSLQNALINTNDIISYTTLICNQDLEDRDRSILTKILFYNGRQEKSGILAKSKISLNKIKPIIKMLLKNEDGNVKSYILDYLKKYKKSELNNFLPELINNAERYSSAGQMGAGWVRIKSLRLVSEIGDTELLMPICIDFLRMRQKASWYFHDSALKILIKKSIKNVDLNHEIKRLEAFLKTVTWKNQASKTIDLINKYKKL